MSLMLYMDAHVRHAVTHGLRRRGIDVLTAQEDGNEDLSDDAMLLRATVLNRVIFSYDRDFSEVTAQMQAQGVNFSGVIATRRRGLTLSTCLDELELVCKVYDPPDIANRLEFVPLQ